MDAEIVIGSFGPSDAYRSLAFQLSVAGDSNAPAASETPVERYGKQPRINHIFKADPKSPPPIIMLIFLLAMLITIPVLAAMVRLSSSVPIAEKRLFGILTVYCAVVIL